MAMKKSLLLLVFLLVISFHNSLAQEQEETIPLYRIETRDGNEFIGSIVSENEETVQLQTERLGEITISRADIRSMQRLQGTLGQDGEFWVENLQATRYFWAPNGYGLKSGEGYYQNVWVLFNQASVGITDNISIGAGMMPLFLFAGAPTPMWITPKFSVPIVEEKLNLGGGALMGTILGEENEFTGFGIVYGVSTFGSRDRNLSVGLGYGYAAGSWAKAPMINVSGIIRTGKNGYFLTENYYLNTGGENGILLSLGGRRMIRKVGLDFGLFIPFSEDMDNFFALPWLGFSVPFGNTP